MPGGPRYLLSTKEGLLHAEESEYEELSKKERAAFEEYRPYIIRAAKEYPRPCVLLWGRLVQFNAECAPRLFANSVTKLEHISVSQTYE